jgi:hypothetical protein
MKWDMVGGAMESHVVVVLNIGKNLILGTHILRVVHAPYVHNNPIDDLSLVIGFRAESSGLVSLVSNSY